MNAEENHNGLQYRTGLNVDSKQFYPSGNCLPGGIYFSDENNILFFCNRGPWIREVKIPKNAQVYENPGFPKKWKADRVILGRRRSLWNLKTFQMLFIYIKDNDLLKNFCLEIASKVGSHEVVDFLLKNGANIDCCSGVALYKAASNGHSKVVKVLIENGANIHYFNDEALLSAFTNGHTKTVKILLKYGANVNANGVLLYAVEQENIDIIKLLLRYGALPTAYIKKCAKTEEIKNLLNNKKFYNRIKIRPKAT
jgi:hypothetical protein